MSQARRRFEAVARGSIRRRETVSRQVYPAGRASTSRQRRRAAITAIFANPTWVARAVSRPARTQAEPFPNRTGGVGPSVVAVEGDSCVNEPGALTGRAAIGVFCDHVGLKAIEGVEHLIAVPAVKRVPAHMSTRIGRVLSRIPRTDWHPRELLLGARPARQRAIVVLVFDLDVWSAQSPPISIGSTATIATWTKSSRSRKSSNRSETR